MKKITKNKAMILFYLINLLSLNIAAVDTFDEEIACKNSTDTDCPHHAVDSGMDGVIINASERSIIESCMSFMAKSIDKSLSGSIHKIKRMDGKEYYFDKNNKNDMDNYHLIFKHIDFNEYKEAYTIIFNNRMADCFEQSFYVGMMLKNTKEIDDKFELFIMNIIWEDDEEHSHVFLIMFPRGTIIENVVLKDIFYFDSCVSKNNLPQEMTKRLENLEVSKLFFNKDVIIIDAWQQKIFEAGNIKLDNHPFSYIDEIAKISDEEEFDYQMMQFSIRSMDISWHGFKNFNAFHERLTK
jgi:hypothetical protein